MMHGTKTSVRTWVLVIFDMICAKNGMAAREVERKYGLCPRTAWFMCHRIRQSMAGGEWLVRSMHGTIVSDETYIGGEPKNRHANNPRRESKRGRGTDKTAVLSLVNAVTGEVRSRIVPNVTGVTLRKIMAEQINMGASHLQTDEGSWYKALGQEFISHQSVNHSAGEYLKNGAGTNMAEGYFSQLKRSLDGTHHHVSAEHLDRYLGEFDFRYFTCKMSDGGRMRTLGKQMEGRLSYKRVTAA
jgi:transposase-like protein